MDDLKARIDRERWGKHLATRRWLQSHSCGFAVNMLVDAVKRAHCPACGDDSLHTSTVPDHDTRSPMETSSHPQPSSDE